DESNHNSTIPAISADGQIITFASEASNLVLNDTNLTNDIFVHDRNSGQTVRVSQSSSGTQSNNYSSYPAISGDGRYVAFQSHASNLVTGDTNGTTDIYVHDRNTHETTRVSVDSSGVPAMFLSFYPDISNSGRYVAFSSIDPNLAAGDFNSAMDIFVHDRDTAQTSLVSVRSNGVPGDGSSNTPAISGDGTIVAFESEATLLVFNDNNALTDIFVNEYTGTAPPPTESDLRISLTDSSDPVDAGGNLSLTATITNVGPADATNVISTIILDSNLTFVRVVTGNCSELSGTVNCTLGDVASGFSSQVSLLVTAPYTAGMLTSTADVSADQVDPLTANNSTSETTSVILRDIDITDSTMPTDDLTILFGTHRVGETTDEIITIHNNSLSIPVTITVITHSLSAPFMVLDPNGCDGAPLAAGDSCVLTVEYSPTVAGDSSDTLILGIGADSVDISVRGTAVENAADLAISKSADKLTVNPGVIGEDLVTFTLTVTNHGPDAANVIVTDLLPAGMQIPTGTTAVASLGSYDETTGVWSVGTMDATQPPQTETLEIPVQVVGSDTCITNTATVAMAPGETSADTNSSNNIDSVTIGTSGGCADLSITGEILVDFTTSSAGYDCLIVEVEVRVRNLGPHTATGVLIQQNAIDYNNNQFNCETGGINDAIVEQTVDLGTLASGASATATVFTHNEMQFEANHQTYRITLDYSATSDGSDPDITNNTYQDSVNITHVEQRNTHESCLIDVATRGSRVSHGLNTLRQFRDQVLNRFMAGRGVIKMYYNLSPPIASIIADSEILKSATRTLLRPIIWWAEITLDSPVLGLLLLVLVTLAPVAIVLAIRRYRLIRRCLYLVNFQRKQMT
ncbi:MAG: DUF11 domain-containing protein, partial [Candidatus Thiodiazotropha sp. (ex Notomyrtea botanica)]|nr:DUF11 domain-containing protein [Candidatus Thiodiazotropha sp. (ex Notomyrtea botanica)]